MFACKTKYHRHRRKLLCQVMKAGLGLAMLSLMFTQTLLIRQAGNMEGDNQSKQTKGIFFRTSFVKSSSESFVGC